MPTSRRQFIANTLLGAIGIAGILPQALAQSAGRGYELINPPQNTSHPDKVEVVEFFWLGCPHCYSFEPTIAQWESTMPDNVAFVREAPPLNKSWEQHSRGFYAAQLMGKEHEFVNAMFTAIHENRQRMRKPSDIADLAQGLGMDRDKFLKTMKSFSVQTRMNRSIQMAKSAGISGVPAIVINGKYRTGASVAGGNQGMIRAIDETIAIEKRTMGLE